MATNIPPHNLAEVCNAAVKLIDKPDVTLGELMRIVKGPDFPTGGLIMGDDGHQGRVPHRAAARSACARCTRSKTCPRKAVRRSCSPRCRSRPASTRSRASSPSWCSSGKIDGVRDIRNESGQGKTRLVIELRPDTNPQIVLNNLFKHTAAQSTFPVNMVALVDDVPRTVTLQEALQHWLDHQVVVVTRRSQFRLQKAQDRLHIVEGLVKALDMIDAIVKAIRASKDRARGADRARWRSPSTSPRSRPTTSSTCRSAASPSSAARSSTRRRRELARDGQGAATRSWPSATCLMGVIREELVAVRDAHKAPRRTQIVTDDAGTIDVVALVEDEPYVVTVTARGYVRAVPERDAASR